jgi:HSP20 family protein
VNTSHSVKGVAAATIRPMAHDPIDRLRGEMEELFADLWQVPRFTRRRGGFRPQIDCYRTERPAALTVVVDLGGIDPSKIQIYADERTLVVAGERHRPRSAGRMYQQMEIDYGRFTRQVALGEDVDVAASKATYKRGILTIVMPLAKKPTGPERVTIQIRNGR